MKHLRCIGGPRHGTTIALAGHETETLMIDPRSPKARVRYTERVVTSGSGLVHYLAPDDLGDIEALRIALGPIEHAKRSFISVEEEQALRDRIEVLETELRQKEERAA